MFKERYIAVANERAVAYGLTVGKQYIVESNGYGLKSVYDLSGNYIIECRTDAFDNYRVIE